MRSPPTRRVWARTVLLINFDDENDGLFDHMPPPAPPARASERTIGATTIPADDEYHAHAQSAEDAVYLDRPYGLGMRVPLYVISPWSKGGHVRPRSSTTRASCAFWKRASASMSPISAPGDAACAAT